MKIPRLTQHGSEVVLLGLIAAGVIWLLGKAIDKSDGNSGAFDLAAFLLVLQAIITAIKDRWTQRSVDRMGDQLAGSAPIDTAPPPQTAQEAARRVADAAEDEKDKISGREPVLPPEPAFNRYPDDPDARP